ncbi:MAG: FHA domain-containing protein [Pyrinomonadaceae bacterium]
MIKCPICGTENLDSSQYCDECGEALRQEQKKISVPEFQSQMAEPPNFQQASSVTSIGIPIFVDEANGANVSGEADNRQLPKNIHATLLIERGAAVGTEFQLSADESYIGRWDADNGVFPDVDLDTHDPEAKVSRRHARIVRENGKYAIEDLGSTNGTFVNRGRRLLPGTRQVLNDGDEIIVGKTFLRFHQV